MEAVAELILHNPSDRWDYCFVFPGFLSGFTTHLEGEIASLLMTPGGWKYSIISGYDITAHSKSAK